MDYANDHPAVYDMLEQCTGQHMEAKTEITEVWLCIKFHNNYM